MIPTSLSLRNFLSYGEHVGTLDFTQFHIACLSGDNGHGKSALLDAMTYALWGEARKSQHERKPDDGLLRLGASEMRVEFGFALGDELFRVIRSYRKRHRRGSAQLELQIYDPEAAAYRTLSEGESLTRTQQRIEQLLCMDYDTFVNSAFIVQGRADAFTAKSARQRKEILSQVLGLERYDRLQGLARLRHQQLDQRCAERRRRLQELEGELAESRQHEREWRQLESRRQELEGEIAGAEGELEALRAQRQRQQQLQQRLGDLEGDIAGARQRLAALDEERQYLEGRQRQDEALLAREEQIERDFATYKRLRAQLDEQDRKMHSLRELEQRRSHLQAQIAEARHQVEQRLRTHGALAEDREEKWRQCRQLLAREAEVVAEFASLEELRRRDGEMEALRVRHEALRHECDQLRHAIELQRRDLHLQIEHAEAQQRELEEALASAPALQEQCRALERRLADLEQCARQCAELKERGGELRAQIEQRRQQRDEWEEKRRRERERRARLQARDEASCPLCGSPLDGEHRRRLEAELERDECRAQQRVAEHERAIAALREELEQMRARYRQLEEESSQLAEVRRQLEACRLRGEQSQRWQRQAERWRQRRAELGDAIETCALAERQRLGKLEEELRQLDYSAEAHRETKRRLAELRGAEGAHARLQETRAQMGRLEAELREARQKAALAQRELDEERYAREEREALRLVVEEVERLAYDPEEHRRLRRGLDELSEVFALQENLRAARERRAGNREALARTHSAAEELRARLRAGEEQRQHLLREMEGLGDVEARRLHWQQRLEEARREHGQLAERRGELRALCERDERLAAEREQLRRQLEEDQSAAWIYHSLDDAFGKDGIQALIIESAVPQIESEANAILARLTDNRIQIAIESLRDLKTGGTRETLDIKIADEIGERSYHLYSGGEAFRTDFALRIALSKVLAMRAGTQLRTLIIDEGFGTQDSRGLEQLVEAIREISRDFDKVLVVTHLAELKRVFPVQIEVTKYPDIGSRFEVVHNS